MNNGKQKEVKIGCVVPAHLLKYLGHLAAAESISTGHTVSVSQLIRRALVRQYQYTDYSVTVQRNTPVVTDAVNGLSRLSK